MSQPQTERIFRDPARFHAEHTAALATLNERLHAVAQLHMVQRKSLQAVANQLQVGTRERARQLAETALRHMLAHAAQTPDSELVYAVARLQRAAETIGIPSWSIKRWKRETLQAAVQKLQRIGLLTTEPSEVQASQLGFYFTKQPQAGMSNLASSMADIQAVLNRHPAGITLEELQDKLQPARRKQLEGWPALDYALSIGAHLNRWRDADLRYRTPSDVVVIKSAWARMLVEVILRAAGRPLHVEEILAAAPGAAAREGRTLPALSLTEWRRAAGANPNVSWTGPSTYGLTEWRLGVDPHQVDHAGRISSYDVIRRLLAERQGIMPKRELESELLARTTLRATSVQAAVEKSEVVTLVAGLAVDPEFTERHGLLATPDVVTTDGAQIKRWRISRCLTVAQLAAAAGVSESTLYTYERGGATTCGRLLDVAEALGAPPSALLQEPVPPAQLWALHQWWRLRHGPGETACQP